jgi:hypothetical protein
MDKGLDRTALYPNRSGSTQYASHGLMRVS